MGDTHITGRHIGRGTHITSEGVHISLVNVCGDTHITGAHISLRQGHKLVEQAINTASGNGDDIITPIIHIVVIAEDQIIRLIPVFKYEQNYIVLLKLTTKFVL